MKTRFGFVSNSSSSSFILDARKPEVQALLPQIESLPHVEGLNRLTGHAIGNDAIQYAKDWIEDYRPDGEWEHLGGWILNWGEKLGEENLVFVRESDEGMGGSFDEYGLDFVKVRKLAEAEMEYH